VNFNYRDADIETVLKFLETALGVPVYRQTPVPQMRVTITNLRPVTVDEALDTFNAVLQTQGVAMLDRRPKFIKIVPLASIKGEELPIVFNPKPDELKPRSRWIRAVLPVSKGEDVTALAAALRNLVSPQGDLVANKTDNSLTVTDTEERIREFRNYLERVAPAVSPSGVEMRVFTLQHIDADEAVTLVRSLLPSASGGAGGGGAKPFNPYESRAPGLVPGAGGVPGAASGAGGAADKAPPLILVPNPRARQLIARGSPEQLKEVEEAVRHVDVAGPNSAAGAGDDSTRVCPLQFADAEAVAENLREILREPSAEPSAAAAVPNVPGVQPVPGAVVDVRRGGGRGASSGSGRLPIRITANREQRCIILSGPKAELDRAEKLIAEIEKLQPVNPQAAVPRIFEVRHGSASEIAATLNRIFEGRTGEDSSSSAPASAGVIAPAAPVAPAAGDESPRPNPYLVQAEPPRRPVRTRTPSRTGGGPAGPRSAMAIPGNKLLVIAPAAEFPQLEKLIQELDSQNGDSGGEYVEVINVPRGRSADDLVRRAMEIFNAGRRPAAKPGEPAPAPVPPAPPAPPPPPGK
jgi:type II secretory pathway component GspD/PulD (secretin)